MRFVFVVSLSTLFWLPGKKETEKIKGANKELLATNSLIVQAFQEFESELSNSMKDSLIKFGKYYLINDSDEKQVITIVIDTIKLAIRTEDYYEVGNSSIIINEYRTFGDKNKPKFIHSRFVGTRAFTAQDILEIYDYNPLNKVFHIDVNSTNEFQVSLKDFFKKETPDSVIEKYSTHFNEFFNVFYNAAGVAQCILVNKQPDNRKENKWILGDLIRFDFIKDKFIRSNPYFN